MNIIQEYLSKWQVEEFGSKLISLILLLIFFIILKKICHLTFKHTIERTLRLSKYKEARQKTLIKLLNSLMNYSLYFILIYWTLVILKVPISSLLAGAGVAGIAIGLGAQGFLSDVINGFFILLENQFDVGEVVEIDTIVGQVSSLGIRTTQIRGFDGTLHFIPNRHITIVSNKSRGDMRVQIDLPIFTHSNLEQITRIITRVNQEKIDKFPEIIGVANIIGPRTLISGQFIFRVELFVENGQQQSIYSIFFKFYQEALVIANIPLPTANTLSTPIIKS